MRHHRRLRLGRALRPPGRIQRIAVHRLQGHTGALRRRLHPRQSIGAVQARIVSDDRALRLFGQIAGDRRFVEIAQLELALIDLGLDLHRIAAIGEHGRLVLHHHARPGRAGKARDPRQPVIGRRQILILMLVLMRHQKAVQALSLHLASKKRQVARTKAGVGGLVECLSHAARPSISRGRIGRPYPPRLRTSALHASRWMRRSSRNPFDV